MDTNQQDLVAQFCSVTGATPDQAQVALDSNNWNLNEAVQLYFAAHEPDEDNHEDESDNNELARDLQQTQTSNVAQSQNQPPPSVRNPPNQQRKMRTLRDLQSDNNSDEEDERDPNMFAGGEKSGLAVQNPGQGGNPLNHFQNIMNQARQNRERPPAAGEEDEPQPTRSTNFSGRAQTLGGDDVPSEVVEDPTSRGQPGPQALPRVTRTLHLWDDGVSIDDGPLFRFDDPANANMMAQINQGRAPLSMLDVQPEQEVDLNLNPHKGENYVQPKPRYKPFGGQGQRLGSPTPGPGTAAPPLASTAATSSSTSAVGGETKVEVDDSAPTTTLQIRLADGTRLTSRFNTTHTIGDVYDFVSRASAASATRSWALMTTFPSKELNDKSLVLGDMSDFKRGGVVVQKWT